MSAATGLERIVWARRSMPVSKAALSVLEQARPCHIGFALPIDAAHARLALWLIEAGFAVSILDESPKAHNADLLAAARQAGAVICTDRAAFSGCDIDLLLDHDGACLELNFAALKGGIIVGEQVYKAAQTSPVPVPVPVPVPMPVPVPVIHLGVSQLIKACVFENGIGQACVSGFLDITNLQIAGRCAVVLGYSAIGRGIAKMAKAYGARVIVVEDNRVWAVQAILDGHQAAPLEQALPEAEVLFAASTPLAQLSRDELELLPEGSFVCCAEASHGRQPIAELWGQSHAMKMRDHVTGYALPSGKSVKVICEGRPLHIEAGGGLPLEYADILVAAHLNAIALLSDAGCTYKNGLHPLTADIETALAKAMLD